jgi:hypothetical protein
MLPPPPPTLLLLLPAGAHPLRRMRSRTSHKCGEVNSPVL